MRVYAYECDEPPLQVLPVLLHAPGHLEQWNKLCCEGKRASLSSAFRTHTAVLGLMAVRVHRASTSGQCLSRKEDLHAFLTGTNVERQVDLIKRWGKGRGQVEGEHWEVL